MVVLSCKKCGEVLDLNDNGCVKLFRAIEFRDIVVSCLFLCSRTRIYCWSILESSISKLTISLCWIDLRKVELYELLIANNCWIICNLDCLPVLGESSPNSLIGSIRLRSSSIAGYCSGDSVLSLRYTLHAPKTSSCEVRF